MSIAPHLLRDGRRGHRYGDAVLIDHLAFDGLRDAFTGLSMGALTEAGNPGYDITREAQDARADGACAVVVTRKSTAVRLGLPLGAPNP